MTHMCLEIREKIEDLLKQGYNFTIIGKETGYHRTTISDEIIKHRIIGKQNTYGTNRVYCENEKFCNNFSGTYCTKKCGDFKYKVCEKLNIPPYVCNGCSKRQHCRLQKFFYRAKEAQKDYEDMLSNSRKGIRIPQEDINQINKIIVPLIKEKGHTVNMIYSNHPDILYFSKVEFYRLIDLGVFNIKNHNLPKKVEYKKRRDNEKRRTREESKIRVDRTYVDYLTYKEDNKNLDTIEMDTVERNKGGKVLLTIHFVKYNFMLMYLLDKQTSEEVSKKWECIKLILGYKRYKEIIKIVLTDNGHEFFKPEVIEMLGEEKVCHLFYCDPNRPDQKGSCEENHKKIAKIFPKPKNGVIKSTFDYLTQEDVNILMSHINSVPRDTLNGLTPFEAIQEIMTIEELNSLGVYEINRDEVILKPSLFKGKVYKK